MHRACNTARQAFDMIYRFMCKKCKTHKKWHVFNKNMYITKKKTFTVNSQKRYSVNIIYIRRRYKREIIWKNTSLGTRRPIDVCIRSILDERTSALDSWRTSWGRAKWNGSRPSVFRPCWTSEMDWFQTKYRQVYCHEDAQGTSFRPLLDVFTGHRSDFKASQREYFFSRGMPKMFKFRCVLQG